MDSASTRVVGVREETPHGRQRAQGRHDGGGKARATRRDEHHTDLLEQNRQGVRDACHVRRLETKGARRPIFERKPPRRRGRRHCASEEDEESAKWVSLSLSLTLSLSLSLGRQKIPYTSEYFLEREHGFRAGDAGEPLARESPSARAKPPLRLSKSGQPQRKWEGANLSFSDPLS